MPDLSGFGARLREIRERAGLTQGELAEKIGVQWQAISRWERGDREPAWSSIVALADALGVTCEAFREEPSPEATAPRKPGRPRKDQSSTVVGVVDPDPTASESTASGSTAGQEGQEREEREERDHDTDDATQRTVEESGPQAEGDGQGRTKRKKGKGK